MPGIFSVSAQDRAHHVAAMQRELYGPPPKGLRLRRPSAKALQRLVIGIDRTHLLETFRIWIVGSVLLKLNRAADLDLLLTRRDDRRISIVELELALYALHRIGRYEAAVQIDSCFRTSKGDALGGILPADKLVKTWRIESPHTGADIDQGRMRHARRVGHFLVVSFRKAAEINYFQKLPLLSDSLRNRFLHPGVSIESCLRYFRAHADQLCSWPPGFGTGEYAGSPNICAR